MILICSVLLQDVTKLTPSSPEVISRQATINIGKVIVLYFSISINCNTVNVYLLFYK